MDEHAAEVTAEEPEEICTIGDAVDVTEGTSNRSGSEDKRYKYH